MDQLAHAFVQHIARLDKCFPCNHGREKGKGAVTCQLVIRQFYQSRLKQAEERRLYNHVFLIDFHIHALKYLNIFLYIYVFCQVCWRDIFY